MAVTGSTHVALEIWDIGGQTIGSTMLSNYIFGAHVRILMIVHIASLNNFFAISRLVYYTHLSLYPHNMIL